MTSGELASYGADIVEGHFEAASKVLESLSTAVSAAEASGTAILQNILVVLHALKGPQALKGASGKSAAGLVWVLSDNLELPADTSRWTSFGENDASRKTHDNAEVAMKQLMHHISFLREKNNLVDKIPMVSLALTSAEALVATATSAILPAAVPLVTAAIGTLAPDLGGVLGGGDWRAELLAEGDLADQMLVETAKHTLMTPTTSRSWSGPSRTTRRASKSSAPISTQARRTTP